MHRSYLLIVLSFIFFLIQTALAMPPFELEQARDGYQIKLTIPHAQLKEVKVNQVMENGSVVNETFLKVLIQGFATTAEVGDPELLISAFQLALEDEKLDVEITDIIEEKISLPNRIYPAQPPEEYHDTKKFFCYNDNAYRRSLERMPYVSVSDIYQYRGQKAASIKFYPLHYDPVKNILTVAKSFTVTFKMARPMVIKSMGSRVFDKQMRVMFQNFRGELGRGITSESFYGKEEYLIISSSTYISNPDLLEFTDFRSKTCNVELVSTSDVGSSKDDYKDYIRGKMPAFCLLVGAYSDFPTHSASNTNSYTYYVASATEDPKPDISLGLFFVRSSQSLTNIVNKTISAETNIGSYPKQFVAFGGNTQQMGDLPPNHCDVIVREMYDDYFSPLGEWEITELYQVNQPRGGKSECIAAMNAGVRFINYNGHGMSSGWSYGNGSWTTSSIGSVSNTVYPFVLSCACQTGNFTYGGECWAEKWLGHENLSAVFIASQTTTYTSMHGLNRGVFKAISDEGITQFGPAFVSGVNYTYDTVSSAELVAWQFHYFGDPAVETMETGPFVTALSPNGGEVLEPGSTVEIEWDDNFEDNIKIELLKNGVVKETIANDIPSESPYSWEIPEDLDDGLDYKIKISHIDNDETTDESDADFTINRRPEFTSDPVTEGAELVEYKYEITTDDNCDLSDLEFFIVGDLPSWLEFVDNGDGTAQLSGTPETGDADDYAITIALIDGIIEDSVEHSFTITIGELAAPEIVEDPEDITITEEDKSATFSVLAKGFLLEYQWQKKEENGTDFEDISGETDSVYVIDKVEESDDGSRFRCVVENPAGEVTSGAALLTVKFTAIKVSFDPVISESEALVAAPNPVAKDKEVIVSFNMEGSFRGYFRIYDAVGNCINETKVVPGVKSFTWDLRNNNGAKVAGASYLAVLTVNDCNTNLQRVLKTYIGVKE